MILMLRMIFPTIYIVLMACGADVHTHLRMPSTRAVYVHVHVQLSEKDGAFFIALND